MGRIFKDKNVCICCGIRPKNGDKYCKDILCLKQHRLDLCEGHFMSDLDLMKHMIQLHKDGFNYMPVCYQLIDRMKIFKMMDDDIDECLT